MKITREEAESLLGRVDFQAAIRRVPANYVGEIWCLYTGAKLCIDTTKAGYGRYYLKGYHYANEDVYFLIRKIRPGAGVPLPPKAVR